MLFFKWTGNRCELLRFVDHVIPQDGAIEAEENNVERMICEEGYQFADGSDYNDVSCDGSSWAESLPDCQSTYLRATSNYRPLSLENVPFMLMIIRTCLHLLSVIFWTVVTCPSLEGIAHSSVNNTNATYQSVAQLECDTGYVLYDDVTSVDVTCTADGNLSVDALQYTCSCELFRHT